jgi:hypothetical protein
VSPEWCVEASPERLAKLKEYDEMSRERKKREGGVTRGGQGEDI